MSHDQMEASKDTESAEMKRKRFLLITVGSAFIFGGLVMFLINEFILNKSDSYKFIVSKSYQDRLKDQLLNGGVQPKGDAQLITSAYYTYLGNKEPTQSGFKEKYIAGAWYTMSELENYFKVIKDASGLTSDEIYIYLCPGIYPAGTINPINHKNVGGKFTTSMVFFKDTSSILQNGSQVLFFKSNNNCLGVYNWGDLEP